MSKEEIATRRERAADKLYAAGAHYVVDTLADLPDVMPTSSMPGWQKASGLKRVNSPSLWPPPAGR